IRSYFPARTSSATMSRIKSEGVGMLVEAVIVIARQSSTGILPVGHAGVPPAVSIRQARRSESVRWRTRCSPAPQTGCLCSATCEYWQTNTRNRSIPRAMTKKQTTDRYTLADLEKWQEVAGQIDPPIRLGVFGDPVAHSLSPQMQNAALRALEINMQYARFHIRPNELRSALRFLRELDFVGINLTVSHKIAGVTQIDMADESASRCGAVNALRLDHE